MLSARRRCAGSHLPILLSLPATLCAPTVIGQPASLVLAAPPSVSRVSTIGKRLLVKPQCWHSPSMPPLLPKQPILSLCAPKLCSYHSEPFPWRSALTFIYRRRCQSPTYHAQYNFPLLKLQPVNVGLCLKQLSFLSHGSKACV